MAIHLEPFDPSRTFVTNRWFRWNGLYLGPGVAFPPAGYEDLASRHNTETLYSNRFIKYGSVTTPDNPAPVKRGDGAGPNSPLVSASSTVITAPPKGFDEKVKQLVDGKTHAELLELAADLDVKKTATKTEIAKAIVKAGNGNS